MDRQHADRKALEDARFESSRPSRPQDNGRRTLIWLLLSLVVCCVLVLAMWGRFHQNPSSTVNPTKSQPAPGRE
jgi:hypothetical protein